jgi:hypothetical protein
MATAEQMTSGAYGSRPIGGTTELDCTIHAFEAWTTTEIASIKDSAGNELITSSLWAGISIPAGKTVFFGTEIKKITLASGSGQGYNSDK